VLKHKYPLHHFYYCSLLFSIPVFLSTMLLQQYKIYCLGTWHNIVMPNIEYPSRKISFQIYAHFPFLVPLGDISNSRSTSFNILNKSTCLRRFFKDWPKTYRETKVCYPNIQQNQCKNYQTQYGLCFQTRAKVLWLWASTGGCPTHSPLPAEGHHLPPMLSAASCFGQKSVSSL